MNGATRVGVSNSNPDASDASFWNSKAIAGSAFNFPRAETSGPPLMKTSPLDPQRAETSRRHVRALNTQFASWVQEQLQNHPDELWEDGVQDYIDHAKGIMEKFSDVVNWLKANSVKGKNLSEAGFPTAQKKSSPESRNNETKLFQDLTAFAPAAPITSFATSWNPGVFSSNQTPQTPVLFGSNNSASINRDSTDDADDENDVEEPSSPSLKKTEEKGVILVHEVKCKLYVKATDPADKDTWKDKGTGQLSIKCREGVSKGTKESKPTIVVRNDVGKVLLNALLYPGIKTNSQKNSLVAIFHSLDDGGGNNGSSSSEIAARTFLIRTRSEEDKNKLAAAIQDYAPSA